MDSFFSFMNMAKTAIMGSVFYINDLYDFLDFIGNVNSGTSYSGTTVFLETDIDFSSCSGKLSPIGRNSENSFMGIFDGKSHTLSNLKISSSSEYAGLFGYAQGAVISNLKLDSTCSISCNSGIQNVYVGGLVGYCIATSKSECVINNCTTAAEVSFSGNTLKSHGRIGGLIGKCQGTDKNGCTIINSMCYSTVKYSGISKESIMGGICGVCNGKDANKKCSIYNSGTYSTLIHSGTVNNKLIMGGLIGSGSNVLMENCVGACPMTSSDKSKKTGGIAGTLKSSNIIRVFWEETQEVDSPCSDKDDSTMIDGTSSAPSKFCIKVAEALNRYKKENFGSNRLGKMALNKNTDYDWILVHMEGGNVNNINRNVFLIQRNFVPTPNREDRPFVGWYGVVTSNGREYYSPLKQGDIEFYARYKV